MKFAKFTIFAWICIALNVAWAAGSEEATQPGVKDEKSLDGLCVQQNEEDLAYKNYCTTLWESFNKIREDRVPGCESGDGVLKVLEEIRLRFAGDENQKGYKDLSKDQKEKGINLFDCNSRAGKDGNSTTLQDIAKDPSKKALFNDIMVNLFMAAGLTISNYDPLHKEKEGAPNGCMELKPEEMKKEEHACGCKTINHDPQANVSAPGQESGPRNCHTSTMCAAYMGLKQIAKDGAMWGKTKDEKGVEHAVGITSIFPRLTEVPVPGKDGETKDSDELKFVKGKMKAYCEEVFKNPGGVVNKWKGLTGQDYSVDASPATASPSATSK